MILIYIGIMLPMTIYLMRNFMKTVPDSLLEAAEIDGCSKRKALTKIMIPLSVPALITSSLVNLVWVWNELLISLVFLQKEELRTSVEHDLDIVRMKRFTYCLEIFVRSEATVDLRKISCVIAVII